MTTTTRSSSRSRRHGPGNGQGGYVLLLTIGAMFIGLIITTVLLTVAFNASSVQTALVDGDREARAAEGALDVAINQIRNNPNTPPYRPPNVDPAPTPGNPDPPKFARYLDCLQVNPDVQMVEDGKPVTVRVGCEAADFSGQNVIPRNDNQVAIRLVGDQYSLVPRNASCSPAAQDTTRVPGLPAYGSYPDSPTNWRSNAGLDATIGTTRTDYEQELCRTRAQLLHLGQVPLKVVGGVEVKNQVVASRTAAGDGPAIDAYGTVIQGGGPFFQEASNRALGSDPNYPTYDPRCGVGEIDDKWSVAGADVSSYAELAEPNDGYACNSARVQALNPGGAGSASGDWTNNDVQISVPTGVPGDRTQGANPRFSNPSSLDCEKWSGAGGGVIVLKGAYDAEQTKILNAWFSKVPADQRAAGWVQHKVAHNGTIYNIGECPNRTFFFNSDTWFDVYDPDIVVPDAAAPGGARIVTDGRPLSDPRRDSLMIDNRESNWVVGSENGMIGWNPSAGQRAPTAGFPNNVCVNQTNQPTATAQTGGSITLSSRTSIYHSAGRVAMCGARNVGQTYHNTAIWQRPSVSLGASLLPTAFQNDDGGWSAKDVPNGTDANDSKTRALRVNGGDRNGVRMLVNFPNIFNIKWEAPDFNGCGIFDIPCYFDRIIQFFVINVQRVGYSLCWIRGDCGLETSPGSGTPAPFYEDFSRSFIAKNFRVPQPGTNVNPTNGSGQPTAFVNTDLPPADISAQKVFVDLAVDNNGWANNASQNIAYTKIKITPSAGSQCTQTYIGNPPNFRMGDDYALMSYDVTDNSYGNCKAQLTDRDRLEGADVEVTINVNPPAFATDQFFIGCTTVFNWLKAIARFLGFSWPDCPIPPGAIVDVDSIALRTEWAPQMDSGSATPPGGYSFSPVNSTGSPSGSTVPGTCPFANACALYDGGTQEGAPGTGTYVGAAAKRDTNWARANGGTGSPVKASLAYTMNDDRLRDGFLPLTQLTISTRMVRTANMDYTTNADTKLDFVFRLPRPIAGADPNLEASYRTCTVSLSGTTLRDAFGNDRNSALDKQINVIGTVPGAITPTSNDCGSVIKQTGDLVGYGSGGDRRQARLRVFTNMKRSNPAGTDDFYWEVDYVSVRAVTDPAQQYLRPPQPMRVTWNPAATGDGSDSNPVASFTVFGPTSVPDNAVEVKWKSRGRATGFAIFNGGSLVPPQGELSPAGCVIGGDTSACHPGLVAGSLASWVENIAADPWTPPIPTARLPDPIATSGATRPPNRNVKLTACIVQDDKGTASRLDDVIYPRAAANVKIGDMNGNVFYPGATVTITRWDRITGDYLQTGNTANSDPRVQTNSCYRPSDENP